MLKKLWRIVYTCLVLVKFNCCFGAETPSIVSDVEGNIYINSAGNGNSTVFINGIDILQLYSDYQDLITNTKDSTSSAAPTITTTASRTATITTISTPSTRTTTTATTTTTQAMRNFYRKIVPDDINANDYFGTSVDVNDDIIVVGVHYDDEYGSDSGSAYVYRVTDTAVDLIQKVIPDDGEAGEFFGCSVSVSGDIVVISAFKDDENGAESGSAYVYRVSSSSVDLIQKVIPDDGAAGDRFGYSVSVSADIVVVGAYLDDEQGSSSGSVYIYRVSVSSVDFVQKFSADDGEPNEYFGASVSVSGDIIVIGAARDDDAGTGMGSAYVYRISGNAVALIGKVLPENDDGATYDYFGSSVSVSGDIVVIGAYFDDENGGESGSASVYRVSVNSVDLIQKVAGNGGDRFGYSVSVSADIVVSGAYLVDDDDNGDDSGAAYVYRVSDNSIDLIKKVVLNDGSASDHFGYSVSVSGDIVVVSGVWDDVGVSNSGSVSVYGLGSLIS